MTRVICSLFYQRLTARRPVRRLGRRKAGFMTVYDIPAAPRNGHELLPVYDSEEYFKFSAEAPVTNMQEETTGDRLAACLVREWGGNVAYGEVGGPGIFVCTDLDVKDDEGIVVTPATAPSERELEMARAAQTRWAERLCLEADDFHRNAQRKRISRHIHWPAAEWLGKKPAWMSAETQAFTSECPVCGSDVKQGKFKCIQCGEIIDPVGYGAWQKETAASVEAARRLEAEAEGELVGAGVKPSFPVKK